MVLDLNEMNLKMKESGIKKVIILVLNEIKLSEIKVNEKSVKEALKLNG